MSKVILVVEDNVGDEKLIVQTLGNIIESNEIVVVRDGVQALEYLFSNNENAEQVLINRPCCIILDLSLPFINGFEVLKQLRSHDPNHYIPVIVLTSSKEPTDITKCYDLGATSYVCKPIDADEFAAIVQQIGSYWLNVNEIPGNR